jgi:Ethanolamine utilization protein EutJ (predicted chaperonin)
MSRTAKFTALGVIAAAFVLVNLGPSIQAAPGAGPGGLTFVLEGNYRVQYECAFMDKTGAKDKEEQVKQIEFHPEYVVLINQTGSGRLVPVHAIKSLKWEQS